MATNSHLRGMTVALILGLLLCSCRSPVRVNTHRLFAGFDYVGSYAGDPSSIPADLNTGNEPAFPAADLAYVYRPRGVEDFRQLGTSKFVERLKEQGFHIQSAPGLHGSGFTSVDPKTTGFVIEFSKRNCGGSITGTQRTNGSEDYVLKMQEGC